MVKTVHDVRPLFEDADLVDSISTAKASEYQLEEIVPDYWEFDSTSDVLEVKTKTTSETGLSIHELIEAGESLLSGEDGVAIVEPRMNETTDDSVILLVLCREIQN